MSTKKKIILIAIVVLVLGLGLYLYKKKKDAEVKPVADTDKAVQVAKAEQVQKVTIKPQLVSDKIVANLDSLKVNPFFKEKEAYDNIMGMLKQLANRADYNAVNAIFRTKRAGSLTTRTLVNALMTDLPNYKSGLEQQWSRIGLVKDSGGVWSFNG